MEILELVGGGVGLTAAASVVTRWLTARSFERKDTMTVLLERVAKLDGRCDELSRQLDSARQLLSDERVRYAQSEAQLRARVDHLETQVRELEAERDEARAEAEALRLRRSTPALDVERAANARKEGGR